MSVNDLKQNDMMNHLLGALRAGTDIGHYGRLVFVMVARHFLSDDEFVDQLAQDKTCDKADARALVAQVRANG